jgi:hypothetical protein
MSCCNLTAQLFINTETSRRETEKTLANEPMNHCTKKSVLLYLSLPNPINLISKNNSLPMGKAKLSCRSQIQWWWKNTSHFVVRGRGSFKRKEEKEEKIRSQERKQSKATERNLKEVFKKQWEPRFVVLSKELEENLITSSRREWIRNVKTR